MYGHSDPMYLMAKAVQRDLYEAAERSRLAAQARRARRRRPTEEIRLAPVSLAPVATPPIPQQRKAS